MSPFSRSRSVAVCRKYVLVPGSALYALLPLAEHTLRWTSRSGGQAERQRTGELLSRNLASILQLQDAVCF